jgi:hypothetical protein
LICDVGLRFVFWFTFNPLPLIQNRISPTRNHQNNTTFQPNKTNLEPNSELFKYAEFIFGFKVFYFETKIIATPLAGPKILRI